MNTNILVSSKEIEKKRFIIGTHDGIFHSDEVVACAILALLHSGEQIEIVRSKDVSYLVEKGADIMVDVGGGFYDHHQPEGNGKRENDVPYASAGIVWREFGRELICKCYNYLYNVKLNSKDHLTLYIFEEIDEKIIQEVDKEDNGISTSIHSFSFIPSFLPIYDSNYCDFDKGFKLALNATIGILEHEIFSTISRFKIILDIHYMIKNNSIDNRILEVPSQIFPWLEPIVSHNSKHTFNTWKYIDFVIFPYPSGGWAAQCVPPSLEKKFDQGVPFPKEWAGQTGKLAEISGVEDATCCHKGCFFVRASSKEGVIALCRKAFLDYEDSL